MYFLECVTMVLSSIVNVDSHVQNLCDCYQPKLPDIKNTIIIIVIIVIIILLENTLFYFK